MVERALITCTWGATKSSAWYEWLAEQMPVATSIVELAPHPAAAQPEESVSDLRSAIGERPSTTLVIGHGLGGQTALRLLAEIDEPIAGFLGVGPWWDITEPWPLVRPWLSAFDYPRARANAGKVQVLLSDHDPYHWSTNAATGIWRYAMGADVTVMPGAFDFSHEQQPAVLAAASEMLD
jgi:predicted alpha/beta hydrolase family esterase